MYNLPPAIHGQIVYEYESVGEGQAWWYGQKNNIHNIVLLIYPIRDIPLYWSCSWWLFTWITKSFPFSYEQLQKKPAQTLCFKATDIC